MTHPSENPLNALRGLSLTEKERSDMRAHLAVVMTNASSVSRPWHTWFVRHAVMTAGLVVLFGTGTVGALAHHAEPEDFLYPLKVHVNNRVEVALAGDREERLNKELEQLDRMMRAEETVAIRIFAEGEDMLESEADEGDDREDDPGAVTDVSAKGINALERGPEGYADDLLEDELEALERELRELEYEAARELGE